MAIMRRCIEDRMAVLGGLPAGSNIRPIEQADWPGVIDCLCRGFPDRKPSYWQHALVKLFARQPVDDLPRCGLLLEVEGRIVGVVLTLYTRHAIDGGDAIRCNLSSLCLDPEFRPYATRLIAMMLRRKDVTYVNISPAPGTVRTNKALGFRILTSGQMMFLPALSAVPQAGRVLDVHSSVTELARLPQAHRNMLVEHAAMGCRALICKCGGDLYPFVLKRRSLMHGVVPCHQVIYCPSLADLSHCAGLLGRHLMRRGILLCLVDANEPVPGLTGHYFADRAIKFVKGPNPPGPGDLTFTELAVFQS